MSSPGGYLYAIGAEGTPLVKIGYAKHVEKRLRMLQTGQPFPLHVIAAIFVDENVHRIEKQVHVFLAAERQRGEWFNIGMDTDGLQVLIERAAQHIVTEDREAEERQREKILPHTEENTESYTPQETIGQRIKRLREKIGVSIAELAEKATVSASDLSDLEDGNRDGELVAVSMVCRLAWQLGVSVDYLSGHYNWQSNYLASTIRPKLRPVCWDRPCNNV